MFRFFSRTDDTTSPLLHIPIDWYAQGSTRTLPLRLTNTGSAGFTDVTLKLISFNANDVVGQAVDDNNWMSANIVGSIGWTPLGEIFIGAMGAGVSVDVDLRLYIPPYNLNENFCATDRITLPTGESFVQLITDWTDLSNRAVYGSFMYGTRMYADASKIAQQGTYDKPIVQINFYDADQAAFYAAQGAEFPGDT